MELKFKYNPKKQEGGGDSSEIVTNMQEDKETDNEETITNESKSYKGQIRVFHLIDSYVLLKKTN